MNSKLAVIICSCTLFLISSPGFALQPSKTPAAKTVMSEAMTLLEKREFTKLEENLGVFLKNEERVDDGQWKFHIAMDGIGGNAAYFADDAAAVDKRFNLIRDWVIQHPESTLAKTALVHAWLSKAWLYRGKKLASETSQHQFVSFEEGLENAFKVLKEIGDAQNSNPELYMAWMNFAVGAGLPTEVVDGIYEQANKAYPEYFYIPLQYLVTKFERWSGDAGTLQTVLKPMSANLELYARGMWLLVDYGEDFRKSGAGYTDVIKNGFSSIQEKFNSTITTNQIAFLSCFQWYDKNIFEKSYSKLEGRLDSIVWKDSENINRCVTWANCNKTSAGK